MAIDADHARRAAELNARQNYVGVTTGIAQVKAQEAALARKPYLQNVRETSAVVMWTTTGAAGAGAVRSHSRPSEACKTWETP